MTDAQAQLEAMKVLIDRATGAIAEATVASCGCGTKSPDPAYHDDACRYRRLEAALSDLQSISFALNKALQDIPLSPHQILI